MRISLARCFFVGIALLFSSPASAADFSGEWSSNQGKMLLRQSGDHVTGTYAGKSGKIDGTVTGNKLAGTYQWTNKPGTFELNMGTDGNTFHGSWHRSSAHGTWTGTRIGGGGSSKPSSSGQLSGSGKPTNPGQLTGGSYPTGATSSAASGANSYEAVCDGCGAKTVNLGRHRFCALTGVASGGFGSACYVRHDGNNWTLQAVDPVHDAATQSQRCLASCMD